MRSSERRKERDRRLPAAHAQGVRWTRAVSPALPSQIVCGLKLQTEQIRTEQNRTEQNRTEQNRAHSLHRALHITDRIHLHPHITSTTIALSNPTASAASLDAVAADIPLTPHSQFIKHTHNRAACTLHLARYTLMLPAFEWGEMLECQHTN